MFLPLEVPRVLTYLSRYINLSGCVPPHSKGHKIVEGSFVVQRQPSLLCNRLEQSQLLVAVPVAMQRQVPTFQKYTRTVEAPQLQFLIISLVLAGISDTSMFICQSVGSGFCCIRSSSCLAAGCLLAKLGLRTMFEDVVTLPNKMWVHDAFCLRPSAGPTCTWRSWLVQDMVNDVDIDGDGQRMLGLTPFHSLSRSRDFLRRFKTCKTHLQLSELSGSRWKTQHTRHILWPPPLRPYC